MIESHPTLKQRLLGELYASRSFFERSIDCLEDQDGQFCPKEGMMTVTQQMAHTADTVDWFMEAVENPEGSCSLPRCC